MVFGSYLLGEQLRDHRSTPAPSALIDEVMRARRARSCSRVSRRRSAMRGVTMMRNMAACLGLLNVATGGKAMAAHSAYVIWYLRGRDDEGRAAS